MLPCVLAKNDGSVINIELVPINEIPPNPWLDDITTVSGNTRTYKTDYKYYKFQWIDDSEDYYPLKYTYHLVDFTFIKKESTVQDYLNNMLCPYWDIAFQKSRFMITNISTSVFRPDYGYAEQWGLSYFHRHHNSQYPDKTIYCGPWALVQKFTDNNTLNFLLMDGLTLNDDEFNVNVTVTTDLLQSCGDLLDYTKFLGDMILTHYPPSMYLYWYFSVLVMSQSIYLGSRGFYSNRDSLSNFQLMTASGIQGKLGFRNRLNIPTYTLVNYGVSILEDTCQSSFVFQKRWFDYYYSLSRLNKISVPQNKINILINWHHQYSDLKLASLPIQGKVNFDNKIWLNITQTKTKIFYRIDNFDNIKFSTLDASLQMKFFPKLIVDFENLSRFSDKNKIVVRKYIDSISSKTYTILPDIERDDRIIYQYGHGVNEYQKTKNFDYFRYEVYQVFGLYNNFTETLDMILGPSYPSSEALSKYCVADSKHVNFDRSNGQIMHIYTCNLSLKINTTQLDNRYSTTCNYIFGLCNLYYVYTLFIIIFISFFNIWYYMIRELFYNLSNIVMLCTSKSYGYTVCRPKFKWSFKAITQSYNVHNLNFWKRMRFFLKFYFYPLHFLLQIISLALLPFYFILEIILAFCNHKFVWYVFPLTFWFGNSIAFQVERGNIIPYCLPLFSDDECSILNVDNINDIDQEYALNSSMQCHDIKGFISNRKNDQFIKTVQFDKSTLMSEECTEEKCVQTRTYRTSIPIYPCKKFKIQKLNKETDYFVINNIDHVISFNTVGYFVPALFHTVHEEITCGYKLCTSNLATLNNPACKQACGMFNLGCQSDEWRDGVCVKWPFWKLFGTNAPPSDVIQHWNTPYQFRCIIRQKSCWNPADKFFGVSDREIMVMDYYSIIPRSWAFVLIEPKTDLWSIDLSVTYGDGHENFKITNVDSDLVMNSDKIGIKTNIEKHDYPNYLLIGFDSVVEKIYARHVFAIESINDLKKIFPFMIKGGFPNVGFPIDSEKWRDDFIDFNLDYSTVIKRLKTAFTELDYNHEFGYQMKLNKGLLTSFQCMPDDAFTEISRKYNNDMAKIKNKCISYIPDFSLYKHDLVYGTMSFEIETMESVVRQERKIEIAEINIEKCSGNTHEVNGLNVSISRRDKGVMVVFFECYTFGQPCGVIPVLPDLQSQPAYITSNSIEDIYFIQTKPYIDNPKRYYLQCKYISHNTPRTLLGIHNRSGIIPSDYDSWWEQFVQALKGGWSFVLFLCSLIVRWWYYFLIILCFCAIIILYMLFSSKNVRINYKRLYSS